MTTPTAEVTILPEVSKTGVKEMERDMDNAFKRIANGAKQVIERGVFSAIRDGATRGANAARSALQRLGGSRLGRAGRAGYDRVGGAAGIGGSILAVGLAGFYENIQRAEQGGALIEGVLGESTAQSQLALARSAGFTADQFGQFTATLQGGGFREQQDINDVLFDLNARVQEQSAEGGYLSEFGQYQGQERINRVLAALSGLSGQERLQRLDELGFSGETGQNLNNVIAQASENGKLAPHETFNRLMEMNKSEGEKLADQLKDEADKANTFREKQLEFQREYRQKFLDGIDNGTVETLFETRKREAEKQTQLIEDFEENSRAARASQESLDLAMGALAKTTSGILEQVQEVVTFTKNLPGKVDEWIADIASKVRIF